MSTGGSLRHGGIRVPLPPAGYYFFSDYTDKCVLHYCTSEQTSSDSYSHCCIYFSALGSMVVGSTHDSSGEPTPPTGGGITVAEQLASEGAGDCADEVALLASSIPWGFKTWWDEDASRAAGSVGSTSIHYVNYKIMRYEIGPNFGLQLYSTNGDVVLVRPDGKSSFKPLGYARGLSIPLNDSLTFIPPEVTAPELSPEGAGSRRLGDGNAPDTNGWETIREREQAERESQQARLAGSCHPMHGCRPLSKVSKADNAAIVQQAVEGVEQPSETVEHETDVYPLHRHRRLRARGRSSVPTSASYSLYRASSNRSANS